jgi:flagellar hook-associated protein 3 FlgL
MLNDAITALTEAVEDNGTSKTIGELASDVVLDHRLLDSQREKHQQYANFASTSIGEIENVDTAEAITFLNFQQVQLQASYELIARIGTLSLTNFLR